MNVNPKRIRLQPQADFSLRSPADGNCLLPVIRNLDPRYLPIWSSAELAFSWQRQLQAEAAVKRETGLLTPNQVKDNRTGLMARSLAGPLPRNEIAQASKVPLVELRRYAKDFGFWVRETLDELNQTPFQSLMWRLFNEYEPGYDHFWFDFDNEVRADVEAEKEINQIRKRWSTPPDVPERIGCWEVIGTPFPAIEKKFGLSWWVEHRCGAPGCQHRRSRWKPLKALLSSRADRCPQHSQPGFRDLDDLAGVGDAYQRLQQRHVPELFRRDLPELRHLDRSAGVLADYRALRDNPPSVKEPKASPVTPIGGTTSLYFGNDYQPDRWELSPEMLALVRSRDF